MQTSISPAQAGCNSALQQSCNRACNSCFTLYLTAILDAIAESRGMGVKQHPTAHATELQQSCNSCFTLTYWAIAESRGVGVKQHPTDREQHWMVSFYPFFLFSLCVRVKQHPRGTRYGLIYFFLFSFRLQVGSRRATGSSTGFFFPCMRSKLICSTNIYILHVYIYI
jgi:hypothetical protein